MARRFIVDNKDIKNIKDDEIEIFGSEIKHIQVNRKNVGDIINVNEFECEILSMKKNSITVKIIGQAEKIGEPSKNLTLYSALLKGEKMDMVIQKAVELGVKKIVPFISKNVVVKIEAKDMLKKKEKFQKVANEACKQCGRTDLVEVLDITSFNSLLDDISKHEVVLFAYEKSNDSLKNEIVKIKKDSINDIAIIVGAEGGFNENEAKNISTINNVKTISLGSRILRAETAAISLCSIIMYELES